MARICLTRPLAVFWVLGFARSAINPTGTGACGYDELISVATGVSDCRTIKSIIE